MTAIKSSINSGMFNRLENRRRKRSKSGKHVNQDRIHGLTTTAITPKKAKKLQHRSKMVQKAVAKEQLAQQLKAKKQAQMKD